MSGYLDNSALDYDFDIFESHERVTNGSAAPKRQAPQSAPAGTPELKVVKSPSQAKHTKVARLTGVRSAFVVLIALVLLGVIGLQISAGAQRYELSSQIKKVENLITEAKTENIRLTNALNSITTIEKIDSYAVNILGMTKSEPYQIKCIDLSGGDQVLYSGSGISALDIFDKNN